jgi:hypothetical protein
MSDRTTRAPWFHIFRISQLPLMWIPVHWKGWLLAIGLIATVVGMVFLGAVLGLNQGHSDVVFFAIVAVVIGFQMIVFTHSD